MFSELPLHPKLVHLPIALAVLVPIFSLVLGHLIYRKNWNLNTWFIVISLQATLVASGFLAMNTGEKEEDRVKDVVEHGYIHEHEEAAEWFVYTGLAVLVISIAPVALKSKIPFLATSVATIIGTILVLSMGIQVGHRGGEIVYKQLIKSQPNEK